MNNKHTEKRLKDCAQVRGLHVRCQSLTGYLLETGGHIYDSPQHAWLLENTCVQPVKQLGACFSANGFGKTSRTHVQR